MDTKKDALENVAPFKHECFGYHGIYVKFKGGKVKYSMKKHLAMGTGKFILSC